MVPIVTLAARGCRCVGEDARTINFATGRLVRYSSLCCPTRQHLAGCPSGQRERSVKPSAKPTQVRTLDLPPPPEMVPELGRVGSEPSPVICSRMRLRARVCGLLCP